MTDGGVTTSVSATKMMEQIELLDWRRRVFDLYQRVRSSVDITNGWKHWCAARNVLFASHPQSPVPESERAAFPSLSYYDYDPQARVLADMEAVSPEHYAIGASDGSAYHFTRFAVASFELLGSRRRMPLYWLDGYSGGLFLPFRDATNSKETYGGGRYLLDTAKGADLGTEGSRLVLDFNFSYNPSCAYDPKWSCPLAPQANLLQLQVRAGERSPTQDP